MKIRHKLNKGLAEVDDEYGERLVESGQWEAAESPRRTRRQSDPALDEG